MAEDRPKHDEPNRREQILNAALEVFAEQGYHKATIKQIAKRAELKSPALIYWYFENKEELLKAVLMQLAPFITASTDPGAFIDSPPEEVLPMLAMMFFSAADQPQSRKLFRVFVSEAIHTPEMVEHIARGGPMIVYNALKAYFKHQMEVGNLRPHNPESSSRAFVAMLLIYLMAYEIMTPFAEGFPPTDEYAKEIVEIFLNGLRTQPGDSK